MPHPPIETYNDRVALKNELLLEKDAQYCSYGDTVHYADPPKIFSRCDGSYLFDDNDTPYLDLQMWYSAVNFGYKNRRLNDALKRQIDTLPQLACQYLHAEKIELAEALCRLMEARLGVKGRVHFNVGGSQAVEDSLKLVRNATGKTLNFAAAPSARPRSPPAIVTAAATDIFPTALNSFHFLIASAVHMR